MSLSQSRTSVSRWVCALWALGFTAGCAGVQTGASEGCKEPDGAPRIAIDCSNEVEYQGRSTSGGASFMGVGAHGETETKALRQVDERVERMAAEHVQICKQYNACVLDRAAYARESQRIRTAYTKVPELLQAIQSAGDDGDARRQAVSDAWRLLVPEEERRELSLSFTVSAQPPGAPMPQVLRGGEQLREGTRLAFAMHVSAPAHVYLVQRTGPEKKLNVLFPDQRIPVSNPIAAAQPMRIPAGGQAFVLDNEDLGTEQVFIIASLEPIASIEEALGRFGKGGPSPTATDAVVDALKSVAGGTRPSCTRGLTLDPGQPAPAEQCGSLTRGLSLAGGPSAPTPRTKGAAPASLSVTTEAGDETIFAAFSFQHVAAGDK